MSFDEGGPPGAPSEVLRHREALEDAAPPSALVDESFRVVHLSETAGRYLQPSAELIARDITELAREELRFDLRTALGRAFSQGEASLSPPIVVRFNDAQHCVHIQVKPARSDRNAIRAAIVFFLEGEALGGSSDKGTSREKQASVERIRELEQELRFAQSQLRTSREELRRAEDALREGEARLRRLQGDRLSSMAKMASTLTHELNQPLSAAANYVEAAQCLLQSCRERPPQLGEALDNAASQMLRAGRIVSHLRDSISAGDPRDNAQSLHAIVRLASELAAPLMKEHKVALTLQLNANRDSVLAETAPIQQVLAHLISNACEAMGESRIRELTIATTLRDETLRVDVIDTREGPSKAVDANFFDPFPSSKSDGHSVGLSISRSVVEAHRGRLWAEPEAGRGAKFSFTLPLSEATVAGPAEP